MEEIIKFRGKNKHNSQWVYGHYYNNHSFGVNQNIIINNDNDDENGQEYIVNRKYVCQYTGLKDFKGQELYAGDFFKDDRTNNIYRVYHYPGGFVINTHVSIWQKDIKNDFIFPIIPLADEQTQSWFKGGCVIIGNIFDNPEIINALW